MKKISLIILSAIIVASVFAQKPEQKSNDRYFTINKNIDILTTILKEIDLFYVDSLEVDKIVTRTINSMLTQLDPYTNYITEEDMGDLKFMTTGEYAGIGSVISYKDSSVVINEPYEGLPADKSGLKPGDVIIQIDEHDVRKYNVQQVSDLLKGAPGTSLEITISRPGEKKDRKIKVVRDLIV